MSLAAKLEEGYNRQCYDELKDVITSVQLWCASDISAAIAKYIDLLRSLCTEAKHPSSALNRYRQACLHHQKGTAYEYTRDILAPHCWQSTIKFLFAAGKPSFTGNVMRTKDLADISAAQIGLAALAEDIASTIIHDLMQLFLKQRGKREAFWTSKGEPFRHLSHSDLLQLVREALLEKEKALPPQGAIPSAMPSVSRVSSSRASYTVEVLEGFVLSPALMQSDVNTKGNGKRVAEQEGENSLKKVKTLLDHVLSQQKQTITYKEKIKGLASAKTDAERQAADAEMKRAVEARLREEQAKKAADAEKKAAEEQRKRARAERRAAEAAKQEAELRDQGKAFEQILEQNQQEFAKIRRENAQLRDRSSEERLCRICVISPANHAIVPCGHVCACEACAPRLQSEAQRQSGKCPICRCRMEFVSRLYF